MTERTSPVLELTDDETRLVLAQRRIDTLKRLDDWITARAGLPKEIISAMARSAGRDHNDGDDSLWVLVEGLVELTDAARADAKRADQPVRLAVYEADVATINGVHDDVLAEDLDDEELRQEQALAAAEAIAAVEAFYAVDTADPEWPGLLAAARIAFYAQDRTTDDVEAPLRRIADEIHLLTEGHGAYLVHLAVENEEKNA
ncbi:hypothetical protein [Gordonia sihwensis]|uniref:hypothetical protein n=1 Tax=Gordonia sihwensis TaxID=173559 RepID=UPI0005EE42DE|nr:hypothetical protein [Gordonia sihwensis]KJR05972.1 hypothetical protein UG54_14975 [Gordonia sihwensis]